MNYDIDILTKYKDVDPLILKQYKPAKRYQIFNQDPKLYPIKVRLPDPPRLNKIKNFGKPAHEQKWVPEQMPIKLKRLEQSCETIDEIWEKLDANQTYFNSEIQFIKRQWKCRLEGEWVYINGEPVYINPWHWFYINPWHIDIGVPKYRSRDWKFFTFAHFCYNTTIAFYPYRVKYKGEYNFFPTDKLAYQFVRKYKLSDNYVQHGEFYVDMKRKVCFGFNYPKFRREGATYRAECIGFEIISKMINANMGIQSMTDSNAKTAYLKAILYPFKKLPFYFKPNYTNTTDSKSGLTFDMPSKKITGKGAYAHIDVGLNSRIDYGIADGAAYDGQKLHFHHHDEVGKFKAPLSLIDIHNVIRECLSEDMGREIIGYTIKTSTVGKMDTQSGGSLYEKLCELSDYTIRDFNGQTSTGLYNLFIPTHDGIIRDQFGNSVIEDPKKGELILDERGNQITTGGKSWIANRRKGKLIKNDFDGLSEDKRLFPESFDECFSVNSDNSNFPVGKMEIRLQELAFDNPKLKRGNFYWKNGEFGKAVEFSPDPTGLWFLSYVMPDSYKNRRYYDGNNETWVPGNTSLFIGGGDPFKSNKTKDNRKSYGGGTMFYKHDRTVDPSDDFTKWKYSHRFVCTYKNRAHDKNKFCEHMLMMCIYFGSKINPEENAPVISEYFEEHGFSGYLYHMYNRKTGKENILPGGTLGNNTLKEEIFTEYSTYFDRHVHKECHPEIINEALACKGPDEMRYYDVFTAGGWALLGNKSIYDQKEEPEVVHIELSDYFNVTKFSS